MTGPREFREQETLACLIIDDPLLRSIYGCLDYRRLLDEMKEHDSFAEIAFIPWNHRRSDPQTIKLLRDNPDRLAICVHGCNHTWSEFACSDADELRALASTALWRMEQHKNLTGLPYDPVIVFPHGRFSAAAMKICKEQGFAAAFNTTIRATDAENPPEGERQRPAIYTYDGFPLFQRRYPKDQSLFLQDLRCGRPILVVEHHSAFRNGYKEITDLIDWINSLGNIRWTSLLNICRRYAGETIPVINLRAVRHAMSFPTGVRAAVRRFFSEVRDNYVETSDLLSKVYQMIHR